MSFLIVYGVIALICSILMSIFFRSRDGITFGSIVTGVIFGCLWGPLVIIIGGVCIYDNIKVLLEKDKSDKHKKYRMYDDEGNFI